MLPKAQLRLQHVYGYAGTSNLASNMFYTHRTTAQRTEVVYYTGGCRRAGRGCTSTDDAAQILDTPAAAAAAAAAVVAAASGAESGKQHYCMCRHTGCSVLSIVIQHVVV